MRTLMTEIYPSYLKLAESGEIQKRVSAFKEMLRNCELCPRRCGVDRISGETGFCRSGDQAMVSSYNAHFGEEPPLVGQGGSGTIFLTNCTMKCVFCQNYPISQEGVGREYTVEQMANMYLSLQKRGCENINFVTPTHLLPQIIEALLIAIEKGFHLPLVYNTSGYERVEIIQMLEEIFDIYLPDIKYSDNNMARKYSGASDYVENNRKSLKEMYRQVGDLECDERGTARKGLIIRHLVLPNEISGSEESLRWLARELSPDVYVALMSQYFPAWKAPGIEEISRRVPPSEYRPVKDLYKQLGFNGWVQTQGQTL